MVESPIFSAPSSPLPISMFLSPTRVFSWNCAPAGFVFSSSLPSHPVRETPGPRKSAEMAYSPQPHPSLSLLSVTPHQKLTLNFARQSPYFFLSAGALVFFFRTRGTHWSCPRFSVHRRCRGVGDVEQENTVFSEGGVWGLGFLVVWGFAVQCSFSGHGVWGLGPKYVFDFRARTSVALKKSLEKSTNAQKKSQTHKVRELEKAGRRGEYRTCSRRSALATFAEKLWLTVIRQ